MGWAARKEIARRQSCRHGKTRPSENRNRPVRTHRAAGADRQYLRGRHGMGRVRRSRHRRARRNSSDRRGQTQKHHRRRIPLAQGYGRTRGKPAPEQAAPLSLLPRCRAQAPWPRAPHMPFRSCLGFYTIAGACQCGNCTCRQAANCSMLTTEWWHNRISAVRIAGNSHGLHGQTCGGRKPVRHGKRAGGPPCPLFQLVRCRMLPSGSLNHAIWKSPALCSPSAKVTPSKS